MEPPIASREMIKKFSLKSVSNESAKYNIPVASHTVMYIYNYLRNHLLHTNDSASSLEFKSSCTSRLRNKQITYVYACPKFNFIRHREGLEK